MDEELSLSKSEYMMFLKHPAWLWLKKHDKGKLPPVDDNTQAIFDAGFEFEGYAQKRFPKGVMLGFNDYDEYLTLAERTEKTWKGGAQTIFQGRFESGRVTCICDIVDRVSDDEVDLYEVKSSTKVKPEHYPDLAFQVAVLESAGFTVRNILVIHVNGNYVRKGKVDPIALVSAEDVTVKVRELIPETEENINLALKVVDSPHMPDSSPRHAKPSSLSEWLDIYKKLGNKIDPYSVYNLMSVGAEDIGELEDLEVRLIKDIPETFKLSAKQMLQVLVTKSGQRKIDKEKIKEFLEALEYPLYFLDYETMMAVVPPYDGTKPYQQIPFQYSLHILPAPGAETVHKEYLHKDAANPISGLLAQLEKDIGPKGSILVWFKIFETTRNKEMAQSFPQYADFLDDMNSRAVDLMEPFAKGHFADKDFFGSSSIKNVLPVLVPSLSYKTLDIQEGQSAQRLWMETVFKGRPHREKIFKDLVEYCKLDTLAMVEIYKVLLLQ